MYIYIYSHIHAHTYKHECAHGQGWLCVQTCHMKNYSSKTIIRYFARAETYPGFKNAHNYAANSAYCTL